MAARGAGNDVRARVYGVGIPLRSSVGLLGSASPFVLRTFPPLVGATRPHIRPGCPRPCPLDTRLRGYDGGLARE